MTISIILAIIFGWMLVNMWLTLVIVKFDGSWISDWEDLFYLFVSSIITPILLIFIARAINKIKGKLKKRRNIH